MFYISALHNHIDKQASAGILKIEKMAVSFCVILIRIFMEHVVLELSHSLYAQNIHLLLIDLHNI